MHTYLPTAIICCLLLAVFPAPARGLDTGLYLAVRGGISYMTVDELENRSGGARPHERRRRSSAQLGALAAGFNAAPVWNLPLRLEFEYAQRKKLDYFSAPILLDGSGYLLKSEIESMTGMGYGYVDIPLWDRFQPFVGAGAGAVRNTVESTRLLNPGDPAVTHERSENMFCWAVATGVSIRLRDLIILEGGYRWISLGDAFFGDPRAWEYEGELYGQDVYMGVRFQF